MFLDVFRTHKLGNDSSDYEDASFPTVSTFASEGEPVIAGVADGATESSFAAAWASRLVALWGSVGGNWDAFAAMLPEAQRTWWAEIDYESLPWYAQHKVEQGAFAAFLGCVVERGAEQIAIHAEAIGDACMIVFSNDRIIVSHPIACPEDFHNSPTLIGSRTDLRELQKRTTAAVNIAVDDVVYLMTDALACWTLQREIEHGDAGTLLAGIRTQRDFDEFVLLQRSSRTSSGTYALKNDDTTLVRLTLRS